MPGARDGTDHSAFAVQYAREYDISYGPFKNYGREARFIHSMVRKFGRGCRVLDIACGTGSHLVQLAQMGLQCTGADINPEMLALTKAKAKQCNVEVDVVPIDMRDMEAFVTDRTFDAALNLFYVFQNVIFHPGQQRTFFRGVRKLLKPEGLFIIELLPEENNLRLFPPGRHYEISRTALADGGTMVVSSTSVIIDETTKELHFFYEHRHPDARIERQTAVSRLQRVFLKDFRALTREAGFEPVGLYGECDETIPFTGDSRKLTAVLRRID